MKIFLVIQRTTNGLMTNYKSPDLPLSESDIENIFGDEQNAAQLANSSVIYTLENQNNYRVYSYINSAVSDNAGRAGYYAIRLLISKDKILINGPAVFSKIAERYEHYFAEEMLPNQDYSKILDAVLQQKYILEKSVLVGSKKSGVFYLKYNADERVDDTMNDERTDLIKKLYLFAKDQSKTDEMIRQSGFKSFVALSNEIKQIKVNNLDRYLKELKINGESVKFSNKENFEIFVLHSDVITYKEYEDKKDRPFSGAVLSIKKPAPKYVQQTYPENSQQQSKGFGLGAILATASAALLFGGGIGWGIKYYSSSKIIEEKNQEIVRINDADPYYFTIDDSIKDFVLVGQNLTYTPNYKFKYNSKDQNWTYESGDGKFQVLNLTVLNEIASKNDLKLDKLSVALEKISGKNLTSISSSGSADNEQSKKDLESGQSTTPEQQGVSSQNPPSGTRTVAVPEQPPIGQSLEDIKKADKERAEKKRREEAKKAEKKNQDAAIKVKDNAGVPKKEAIKGAKNELTLDPEKKQNNER